MGKNIDNQDIDLRSILIIDDDVNITNALGRILKKDYTIITANSIEEASKQLLEKEFPVILLDYELGENRDGVLFSKQIHKMHPRSFIVMFTGHKEFSLVKRAINEGSINYFIHKPVNTKKLRELITEAIGKYKNKIQLSSFLQNPQGLDKAKLLLSDIISNKIASETNDNDFEITAIVISKGSIPVYSKFFNEDKLQSFSDTMFAGFMSALVMVGDEVFSMSKSVESLRFNQISIYFRFFQDYQISFILYTPNIIEYEYINTALNDFTKGIQEQVVKNPLFFGWTHEYNEKIDQLLENLQNALSI